MRGIYINVGHGVRANGRQDPGAVGPTGLREHDVVTDLAGRVGHLLRAAGAPTLGGRVEWRGRSVSESNRFRADALLMLHCNAATTPAAEGLETWCLPDAASKALGAHVQAAMVQGLRTPGGWREPAYLVRDRGIKLATGNASPKGAYYCLRGSTRPGILVEALFISNPIEEGLLRDRHTLQEIAQGICNGVLAWLAERR